MLMNVIALRMYSIFFFLRENIVDSAIITKYSDEYSKVH